MSDYGNDEYQVCRACRQGQPGCTCGYRPESYWVVREENLQRWGLRPKGTSVESKTKRAE